MIARPNPISSVDAVIGRRMKSRRNEINMTQMQIAAAVGVRYQQVQKYESGKDRVSAARLWEIAKTLNVPIGYFFEGE